VFVPSFNKALFLGTIGLILYFRESSRLASAYGIAVSAAMLITTILALLWLRKHARLHWGVIGVVSFFFLIPSTAFFAANALKMATGGWIIVLISSIAFTLMLTWRTGREVLRRKAEMQTLDMKLFVEDIRRTRPQRVPGTAIFLTGNPHGVPRALLHNFKHNKIVHACTILLTVRTETVPFIAANRHAMVQPLGEGLFHIVMRFGFSEAPDVPAVLEQITEHGLSFAPMTTTYFLSKESMILTRNPVMPMWQKRLFYYMSRNALDASSFFALPPNRVVELGLQLEL
jgi:KUP system potassium uptake protein